MSDKLKAVLDYHARTKHHLHRFAASPGYLEWKTQPDPFRTFAGADRVELPLAAELLQASYDDLHSPGTVSPRPLNIETVATLFELSLGLSAWKQYGETRWALRCNPSSGNLHPTEGYAVLPNMPGLLAGAYHYESRDHCLERRCTFEGSLLSQESFLVGLSSIHWREAWKYGERAFRYCQHDMGHAIAAVRYAAASLGWTVTVVDDISDSVVADVLGLLRPESVAGIAPEDREEPGVLLLVGSGDSIKTDILRLQNALRATAWKGIPNALSPAHESWPAIDEVAEAAWRENGMAIEGFHAEDTPIYPHRRSSVPAVQIIKQRRSAVALDGVTSISAESFYSMLDRLLPRPGVPPWDAWPWKPQLHCGIFVHRVQGLVSGLYLFERSEGVHEKLRSALSPDFLFSVPGGCPAHLRLFMLAEGDFRERAQMVSCRQQIAANGAFSLGMLAEFSESLEQMGAWWYRRMFWESGLIGQVLYLEAEAAGIRGTGIGCYFDDAFHHILGLEGNHFQSLYHFTMGGPVEDARLMTLPGYAHLKDRR
jgi:SagB-type dehydrogenase family enzyme